MNGRARAALKQRLRSQTPGLAPRPARWRSPATINRTGPASKDFRWLPVTDDYRTRRVCPSPSFRLILEAVAPFPKEVTSEAAARSCRRESRERVQDGYSQRFEMLEIPGQNRQPVTLRGGRDDDVDEPWRLTLSAGTV